MNNNGAAHTLLAILSIPFILAVSHDVYLNFFSSPEKIEEVKSLNIDPDKFQMTPLGWVWTQYSQITHDMVRDSVSPEIWKNKIVPVLKSKTIVVSAVPLGVGIVYTFFAWLLGIWPFAHLQRFKRLTGKKDAPSVYATDKAKKATYGRK